jgi:hypothetical protein
MAPHSLAGLQEQSLVDIYKSGIDETKCIEGTIKMAWGISDERFVEALVDVREYKFRVFFRLRSEHLDVLQALRPRDKFRLSLRGAKLQKLNTIPKLSTLPLHLTFSDGVELQWQQQDGNTKSLNTWKGNFHHML